MKYASLSYLFMCIEVLFYFSSLWILGKHDTLHIFAKKNPQYINFDESMDYFSYIIEEDYENCSSVSWYQKHWMLIIVEQTDEKLLQRQLFSLWSMDYLINLSPNYIHLLFTDKLVEFILNYKSHKFSRYNSSSYFKLSKKRGTYP